MLLSNVLKCFHTEVVYQLLITKRKRLKNYFGTGKAKYLILNYSNDTHLQMPITSTRKSKL